MKTRMLRSPSTAMTLALAAFSAAPALAQSPDPSTLIPGVTVWAYDLGDRLPRRPTIAEGQTPNVYFNTETIDLKDGVGEGAARLTDDFCGEVRGWLNITEPGVYNFLIICDDGAAVFIDDATQATADTETPGGPEKFMQEGAVTLAPGPHKLSIPFYEDRGDFKLQLKWRPPGTHGWQPVPSSALRTEPGQTFAVSPGRKRWFMGADPNRPGDGRPLESVHPSMTLENFRGPNYQPHVGAMCFLPDGRLAIATWDPAGTVDILSNLDGAAPGGVVVKQFASGLGEPLGMAVVDGDLVVTQKQEITRLRDTDGDGVADRYEAIASGWPASHNYHEFSFNLVPFNGSLYFTTSVPLKSGVTMYEPSALQSDRGNPDASAFPVPDGPGSVWKCDPKTGELTAIGRGLRAPNGMNLGFDGQLYCCDNQGAWLPSSKLNRIRVDKPVFYGHQRRPDGQVPSVPPVAWFPQGEIGNSPSQPILIPDGPYRGQMLVGDVTYGGLQRVFIEKVGGEYQGCVFRFSQGLEAGVNRLVWGPDGCLYVGGVGSNGNWNHNNTKFGLQRLRPHWNKTTFEMHRIESRADGLLLTLTKPVPESVLTDAAHYQVATFRYQPTVDYGGPKVDFTPRPIRRLIASPDRTRVFLDIPDLAPGAVAYLRLRDLKSDDGDEPFSTEAWYTLNAISHVAGPGFDEPVKREPKPAAPPPGATVLFDGTTLDHFSRLDGSKPHWTINPNHELVVSLAGGGVNEGDLITREKFGDCFLHVEWLSPPGGDVGKQTNGNSGVKLQLCYEIQVMNAPGCGLWGETLDPPLFNEAGAIYRQTPPAHNASAGPGVWQTYDIKFRAPRWSGDKKSENARITMWWNGVLVHDNVEIKNKTGMSVAESPGEHPLLLQSHPNEAIGPVRYRNVWVVRNSPGQRTTHNKQHTAHNTQENKTNGVPRLDRCSGGERQAVQPPAMNDPRRLIMINVLFALAASIPLQPPPEPPSRPSFLPPDYQLTWHDEFDGAAGSPPDPAKWAPRGLGKRRDAINVEEAARLDGDGHLVITTTRHETPAAEPNQPPRVEYHTGMISTTGKHEVTYGYIECRYRVQTQPGHWSAFWLNSTDMGKHIGDPAAAGAEIDVQEYLAVDRYTDLAQHTIHWDGYGQEHKSKHVEKKIEGLGQGFHTYGVLWTPDEYIFYTDGQETGRIREGVSRHPEFLLLSLEVGKWAKDIAAAKLPDSMVVDYVRIWQKPQAKP